MDSLFNLTYFVYSRSNLPKVELPTDIIERGRDLKTSKMKNVKTLSHLRYVVDVNKWIDYDRAFRKALKFKCTDVIEKLIGFQSYCNVYKNIWKCCKYGNVNICRIFINNLIQKGQLLETIIKRFLVDLLSYFNSEILEYLGTFPDVNNYNLYKFLVDLHNRENRIQKLRQTIIYLREFNHNDTSQYDIYYENQLIFRYYAVKERELFNDILELGVAPLRRRYQQYIYLFGNPELIRQWYDRYGINRRNYMWSLLRIDQFTIGQIDNNTHPGYNGDLSLEREDIIDYIHCIGKKERKDIFDRFYETYFKHLVPDLPEPGTSIIPTYKEWCLIAYDRFTETMKQKWKVSLSYYQYVYVTRSPQDALNLAIKTDDWEIICDFIDMGILPSDPKDRILEYINRQK